MVTSTITNNNELFLKQMNTFCRILQQTYVYASTHLLIRIDTYNAYEIPCYKC